MANLTNQTRASFFLMTEEDTFYMVFGELFVLLFVSSALYLFLLLRRAGDVELNPGPGLSVSDFVSLKNQLLEAAARLGLSSYLPDVLNNSPFVYENVESLIFMCDTLQLLSGSPLHNDQSERTFVNFVNIIVRASNDIHPADLHVYPDGVLEPLPPRIMPDILNDLLPVHDLVREGIEPNPGPFNLVNLNAKILAAKEKYDTFMSLSQFNRAFGNDTHTSYMLLDLHLVGYKYDCAFESESAIMKRKTLEECSIFMNMFHTQLSKNILQIGYRDEGCEDCIDWTIDLTTQGIEPNPGPAILSKSVTSCYNRLSDVFPLFSSELITALASRFIVSEAQMGLQNFIFGSSADVLPRVAEQICDVVSDANDDIRENVNNIRSDITAGLAAVPEMIKDFLDAQCGFLPVDMRTVLQLLGVVICLYLFYKLMSLSCDIVFFMLTAVGCALHIPAAVLRIIRAWFERDAIPVAQIGGVDDKIFAALPGCFGLLGAVLTGYLSYEVPSKPMNMDIWFRRIKDIPLTCRSISSIYDFCMSQFKLVWKYVREDCLGYDPDVCGNAIPEIENWMKDVLAHTDQNFLDAVCQTRDGVHHATMLWLCGEKLLQKYARALTREATDAMKRILVQAARIKSAVEVKFPVVEGVRMSPLCIWLVGESQIGKTQMQFFLASHLTKELGTQANVKEQIYVRAPENVYWDGYHGQDIVCFDDFGQLRDVAGTPNPEFFELIRGVSHFPYPLHMADISQKSNTAFTSKAFICSTNAQNVQIESLTYEEAVWNRFTHSYRVEIKPEFTKTYHKNGRPHTCMDREKVLADAPDWNGEKAPVNLNIYNFYPFDARNRRNPMYGTPLSFDEVALQLRRALRERLNGGKALDKYLDHYTAAIAQVGEEREYCDASSYITAQIGNIHTLREPKLRLPPGIETYNELFAEYPMLAEKSILDLLDFVLRKCNTTNEVYCAMEDYYEHTVGVEHFDTTAISEVPLPVDVIDKTDLSNCLVHYLIYLKPVKKSRWARYASTISNALRTVKDFLSPFACKLYNCMESLVNRVCKSDTALCLGVVVLGCGLGFLRDYLSKQYVQTVRVDGLNSCESDTRNAQPRARSHQVARSRARLAPKKTAQVGVDLNQQNVITKVARNQYLAVAQFGDKSVALGTVTFVVGTIAMMPDHFRLYLESCSPQPEKIVLYSAVGKIEYSIGITDFFHTYDVDTGNFATFNTGEHDAKDLILVDLTRHVPRHASIVRHFISMSDSVKLNDGNFEVTLTGLSHRPNGVLMYDRTGIAYPVASVEYEMRASSTVKCVATNVYAYHFATSRGDCGATLSVNSNLVTGKIIGIHVAGSVINNWSQSIVREDIEMALAVFPAIAQCEGQFVDLVDSEKELDLPGFHVRGDLVVEIPLGGKSNIRRSTLHGLISAPITKPAYLFPRVVNGEYIDPLLRGVLKASVPRPFLDPILLTRCANDVGHILSTEFVPNPPVLRVLSYEEAIRGIEGDPLFHGVSRSTSPGYPYCLSKKGKGKTMWMGRDDYDFDSENAQALRSDVFEFIEACRTSKPKDVLWIDTLKDERRPIAKVDAMKTRVFSNGPQHFNIAFRMYFLSALAYWRHNRILNGTSVGMNVWSEEWDFLYRYLSGNSRRIVAGDFEAHDGNCHDQPMWAICDIINSQYNDGNDEIRLNMWHYVVYAARSYRNCVYVCTHSLPSGFIATADVTSVYELILFRYVYIKCAEKRAPQYATLEYFNQFVKLVTYGDDNLVSISEHILSWYNMLTIKEEFALIGQNYTDAAKTGEIVASQDIEEVQYLKRSFSSVKLRSGKMSFRKYCPADLPSRLEMLNWTRHGNVEDFRVVERQTIQDVFKELAMHGYDVYYKYSTLIKRLALEHGIKGVVDEGFDFYLQCDKPLFNISQ
jgi:hypothetical protein